MADFCLLEVRSFLMQKIEGVDQREELKFGIAGKSEGRRNYSWDVFIVGQKSLL